MTAPIRQTAAFPEVAIIRKGTPKKKGQPKNGKDTWIQGSDLKNKFRINFLPGTDGTRAVFHKIHEKEYVQYGPQFAIADGYEVKELRAMIPFGDAFKGWDWGNEAYNSGRLIAKANDEYYITKRDPLTGEYIIRDGEPQLRYMIGDVITYERNGNKYSLPVKFKGNLRLFLPEMEQFVTFTLKTTSFYDRTTIEANLGSMQEVANILNGGISGGIPFYMYRAEKDVAWNHKDGTASRTKIWSVFLRVDEKWVKTAMRRMSNFALGDGLSGLLQAPDVELKGEADPTDETFDDENMVDAAFVPEAEEVKPVIINTTTPVPKVERPLSAETLRAFMSKKIAKHAAAKVTVPQVDRQIVAAVLNNIFAGEQTKRYEFCKWLVGAASTKEMSQAQVKAIQDWLECPNFDSVPPAYVIAEANAAHSAALIASGQIQMEGMK